MKEEKRKIIEKMGEIEKRMEYLLQKEKKLLDKVAEDVIKRKSLMLNLDYE